jgi:hypothetical protein
MSDEAEIIPEVPFGLAELRGIERILWAYSKYLRRSGTPAKDAQRIQAIESMRKRLDAQLAADDMTNIQMFLDVEEMGLLLEAMQEFGRLVTSMFPPNAERDSVIEAVDTWQRRLTTIVAESDTTSD